MLKGSAWKGTDPGGQIIVGSVEKAHAPSLFNGLAMDSVSGRAISRGAQKGETRAILQDDHLRGRSITAGTALLAQRGRRGRCTGRR
ncbi:hypothetical protein [Streptomyces spinoverrucosus]|uniref:hypothetical protein n=1 Tax=Streptomyces spinoverrucosus TaxID=284043 RepID=UPI001E48D326|nr:hypothetical protein [Streptomyces spinoverrucosus]